MSLESLTGPSVFINALINSNPTGNDPKSEGDDHLRGIKNTLLNTFPNISGAVTASHTAINRLNNITGNGNIDSFAAGTKMVFYQAAAPTGWTQDTSKNDYMLRVVSSAGGGFGGTDSAILNNKIPTHSHTASSNTTGEHTHTQKWKSITGGTLAGGDPNSVSTYTTPTGSAGAHAHTITVNSNSGSNWTPKYVNMIICTKDA